MEKQRPRLMRRLYDWILHFAETPWGTWALFLLAFAESSFFPIPPDVLLIAMALAVPAGAFRYAAVCTAGSVLGGMLGYFIGYGFMEAVGFRILDFYGLKAKFDVIGDLYNRYSAWAVGIAGFTPVPYKVFTIAGGAFRIDFTMFVLVSLVSRGARFFLVSFLFYRFGEGIKTFIDRYFNILTILFMILLVGGFILVRYVLQ